MVAPFTAHLGHVLLDQTPAHVAEALRPEHVDEPSEEKDLGSIVHGVLLTGEANVVLVDAPDWRTKVAREAREAARLEGKTPLLVHKWAAVKAMVEAARHQLEAHELPTPFVGGVAEASLYFTLEGVACRGTPDWRASDHRHVCEYKTTSISAHPGAFSKALWGNGYAIQCALYRRGVKALYGVLPDWRWIVQETYPPYALAAVSLDPEAEAFADAQLDEALRLWKACQASGVWPGYAPRVAYAEVPTWVQAQWIERTYYSAQFSAR